ncbi:MAG TPA: S8 family serine peptidase [Myxococcaceae bacterium]
MTGSASARLLQQGGRLVADYGSFALVDVDGAKVSALPEGSYQLRDEYQEILLNAGSINTLDAAAARMRETTLPSSGRGLHLVQFAGAMKNEWHAGLQGSGVQVVAYIPHNAYLVYGDATSLSRLISYAKAAPEVQWDGPYLNDYKLNPQVFTFEKPDGYEVQLVEDAQGNADTLARAAALDPKLIDQRALGYVNLVVRADRDSVLALAKQPDVVSIYPWVMPRKLDERANVIAAGQLNAGGSTPTSPGHLAWLASKGFTQAQFDATNVGVDVSDSGLDNGTQSPNHFSLYTNGNITGTSRVTYNRLVGTPHSGSTIQGCDGHGNLNSHIIMGFNNLTGAPHQDAAGYRYNLGIVPFARVGSSVVFDPDTFTSPDFEDLQAMAYRDGMRVSSNSWGAAVSGAYNASSQRYDALVRDAQPTGSTVPVAGNQEMIIVFAAGNSGSGAGTVGSPGTAKNVITAGAANNVHPFGAADQCNVPDTDADSANDIVGFSSRGPCTDGRIKPDLVAAGTHVSGGVAQSAGQHANPPGNPNGEQLACFDATGVCAGPGTSNFWPVGQQWTTASSGTSHSTPLIAGAALLARQRIINTLFFTPSATLVKAWLINSARYMTGSAANDNLYSNNQGMGHLDLGFAFDDTARFMRDEDPADLFTATGQTRTFNIFAGDPSLPFRVTLAWTDAPGSTTGNSFNNNLDLTVAVGGNTYRGNVFTGRNSVTGGSADTRNNVESVFLPPGTTGPATVTVTATNINSDGLPGNASALDQDFALVAYNTCPTRGTAPTGVTATPSGPNQIRIDWVDPGGNTDYRIYRSTTAGGPYTPAGSVTAPATTFTDTPVSGGSTYFYVVRGVSCAESINSSEASATATGDCLLLPVFAGLTSASNAVASTCGVNLSWGAATQSCAGPITYNVYRSRTSGFTPGAANRIATGVTGTSYADAANLVFPNTYYYVVHAVESSGSSLNEEANTVQRSVQPTGTVVPAIRYFDDLDGTRPPNADAYWQTGGTGAANIQTSTCHFQSTTTAWRFGGTTGNTCPGAYANDLTPTLTLGGDGSVAPAINGFTFPVAGTGSLSFRHGWNLENNFDGVVLNYSTTSAAGPWTKVGTTASTTAPYITAGGYNGTNSAQGASWTNIVGPTNGSFQLTTVNVDALFGQTVWFQWGYRTDFSVTREGHYLDDIDLTVDAYGACTAGSAPPGPAVSYRVTLPASAQAGVAANATIDAQDSLEQVASGYTGTANLTSSDGQATFPATASFTAGTAAASVTFGTVGPQTLTAVDSTNSALQATGNTTVTPGVPAALGFSAQPSDAIAGVTIAPAVKVRVTDAFGNLVPTATNSITLSINANPGGGTLLGTATQIPVAGEATFNNLSIRQAGAGYTLDASAAGLTTDTSSAFTISPDVPVGVRWGTQPSNALAGAPFNPVAVAEAIDQYGNVNGSSVWTVFVSIANNPSNGTLLGTTMRDTVNGRVTFPDLAVNRVGAGYTLSANFFGFAQVTSAAFDIFANVPHHITVTQQPGNTAVNVPTSTVVATVRDAFENLETGSTAAITASLAGGTPGARLSGTTTVSAVGGMASFNDLAVDRAGQAYSLVLGSSGLSGAVTSAFNVASGPAPATHLAFGTQPSNAAAGSAITPSVTVEAHDASGNLDATFTGSVSLALNGGNPSAVLGGTTTVSAVAGVATFPGLSVNKKAKGYSLSASAGGLAGATSASFNISSGPASKLAISGLSASATSFAPVPFTVTAYDAQDNVAEDYVGPAAVTSDDSRATLPANPSFASGVASDVKLTFKTTGVHRVTVADTANTALTASASLVVTNFPQPTVSITAPGNGASVTGSAVTITAEGAVATGTTLTGIDIFVDGTMLTSGTSSPVTGSWDASQLKTGTTHLIHAVITDGAGNVVQSTPLVVNIGQQGCGCSTGSGGADTALLAAVGAALRAFALRRRRAAR